MKPVIKYTTFEDLKSSEKGSLDFELRLKRHDDLRKFLEELWHTKTQKKKQSHKKL